MEPRWKQLLETACLRAKTRNNDIEHSQSNEMSEATEKARAGGCNSICTCLEALEELGEE